MIVLADLLSVNSPAIADFKREMTEHSVRDDITG